MLSSQPPQPKLAMEHSANDFLTMPSEHCLPALLDLTRHIQAEESSRLYQTAVQRKLLDILSLKEAPQDLQDAASELLEILERPSLAEAELVELVGSQEIREWLLGQFFVANEQPSLESSLFMSRHIYHCTKRERIRRPIATSIYPSSKLLGQLLLSCPELVMDQEVLELGAGFHGLPSLVAACCGARHVLCSEMDPVALHQLDINTKDSGVEVMKLDWSAPTDLRKFQAIACREVVLGSDIVHETWMGPAALEILMQCLMPGGRAVIVLPASHHRYGVEEFQQLLRSMEEERVLSATLIDGSGTWSAFPEQVLRSTDAEDLSYDCYLICVL
ncbi:unnamed protein product [Durusdinium trenchii]|uniref:Calmodulin-lysine N-methyltransferase n=1 Tax=Durusdinium trenchii TaxID=1381693 RepID=A0ABP0JJQ7_9DINO